MKYMYSIRLGVSLAQNNGAAETYFYIVEQYRQEQAF